MNSWYMTIDVARCPVHYTADGKAPLALLSDAAEIALRNA
jgi:hypothetical protein